MDRVGREPGPAQGHGLTHCSGDPPHASQASPRGPSTSLPTTVSGTQVGMRGDWTVPQWVGTA